MKQTNIYLIAFCICFLSLGACKKSSNTTTTTTTPTTTDWAAGMVGTYTDLTHSTYKSVITEVNSKLIGLAETGGTPPLDSVVLTSSSQFTIHEFASNSFVNGSGTYGTNTIAYTLQLTDRSTGNQSVVHSFNGTK